MMERHQPHIRCAAGDVAPYVLLPGDPARVETIARHLDHWREVAHHREYRTITGTYQGMPVSVTSTGIGGPSTAIAVEELIRVGTRVLIRVGSAGAMQSHMAVGDLVVPIGAVREEGTSAIYVPAAYPAVPDLAAAQALLQAARGAGPTGATASTTSTDPAGATASATSAAVPAAAVPAGPAPSTSPRIHSGVVRSHDSFYTDREEELMTFWSARGIIASDMETATLFTVARLRGARAGSIN